MGQMNERLLSSWLRVSTTIVNSRVVSELTYNEALVCNALYRNKMLCIGKNLTATELCNETKMVKSQINRTLNMLENKGIITRTRSQIDKRCVFVTLNEGNDDLYMIQHNRILALLDGIMAELGEEKTKQTIETLDAVAEIAEKLITRRTR